MSLILDTELKNFRNFDNRLFRFSDRNNIILGNAANDNINSGVVIDGSYDNTNIIPIESFDAIFTENNGYYHKSRTVAAALLSAGYFYFIQWENCETDNGNATTCYVPTIQINYYIKRG